MIVLFIALFFEALGVVILKQGIDQIAAHEKARQGGDIKASPSTVLRLIGQGFVNSRVLLGVLFEAIFFAGLLFLMGHRDISFVWPLTSLSMVATTIAAIFILREKVSGTRWAGVVLMMLGAALITWSEQKREAERNALTPPSRAPAAK
ncbi:MAG TPA: EamA family transporter [Candidatus Limnocylindria bacterium]|nr:EamA family transporter [Candidatus Limnocylindria bacterium]